MSERAVSDRQPPTTRRAPAAAVLAAISFAVIAAAVFGARLWTESGARLEGGGYGAGRGGVSVGEDTWVDYELRAVGGTVELDGARLEPPSAASAEFFVSTGPCSWGITLDPPVGCERQPLPGATISENDHAILVVRYWLEAATTAPDIDVVVSYHDGLHRREFTLGTSMCLSPDPLIEEPADALGTPTPDRGPCG